MEQTFLQAAAENPGGFFLLVILPAVAAIALVAKHPKTTLNLIKAVFEFTKTHVLPKVLKLIVFVAPVTKAMLVEGLTSMGGEPSTSSTSSRSVNKQATYQNGVDGPMRTGNVVYK